MEQSPYEKIQETIDQPINETTGESKSEPADLSCVPDDAQEKTAQHEKAPRRGNSFFAVLYMQTVICIGMAAVFLFGKLLMPSAAALITDTVKRLMTSDFSFHDTLTDKVSQTILEIFTYEAAAAGTDGEVPANATLAPVVYTGTPVFPLEEDAYRLSSPFGFRTHPISGGLDFHTGVDLAAPEGTRIFAVEDGTVIESRYDDAYGNFVKIDHGNGYYTYYGHCSERIAQKGMRVRGGDVIALVGSTGNSTGNHLHFGVITKGLYVNPAYLFETLSDEPVSLLLESEGAE